MLAGHLTGWGSHGYSLSPCFLNRSFQYSIQSEKLMGIKFGSLFSTSMEIKVSIFDGWLSVGCDERLGHVSGLVK